MVKLKSLVIIGLSLALIGALLKGLHNYASQSNFKQKTEQIFVENIVSAIENNLNGVRAFLIGIKKAISSKNYSLAKTYLDQAKELLSDKKNIPNNAPKSLFDAYDSLKTQLGELEIQIQEESQI